MAADPVTPSVRAYGSRSEVDDASLRPRDRISGERALAPLKAWVVAAALVLLGSACVSTDEPANPSTSRPSAATSSPSAATSSPSAEPNEVMDDFISEWTSYNTYVQNNYTNYSPAESANLEHFISHVKKTATVLGQMLAALADLRARLVPLFEVEIDAGRIAPAEADDFHDMIVTYGDWIANQREQSEGLLRCIERDTTAALVFSCLRTLAETEGRYGDALALHIHELQARPSS